VNDRHIARLFVRCQQKTSVRVALKIDNQFWAKGLPGGVHRFLRPNAFPESVIGFSLSDLLSVRTSFFATSEAAFRIMDTTTGLMGCTFPPLYRFFTESTIGGGPTHGPSGRSKMLIARSWI
jgi:hypothetical protein